MVLSGRLRSNKDGENNGITTQDMPRPIIEFVQCTPRQGFEERRQLSGS